MTAVRYVLMVRQVAVAVRVMTSSLMPNGRVDDFVKEAGRLLIHHHIVKVFGVVHDDRSSLVTMVSVNWCSDELTTHLSVFDVLDLHNYGVLLLKLYCIKSN